MYLDRQSDIKDTDLPNTFTKDYLHANSDTKRSSKQPNMKSNAHPTTSNSNIQVDDNTSQYFNRVSTIPTPLSLRASDFDTNRDHKPSPSALKPPDARKEEPPDIRWFGVASPCQSPPPVWSLDGALLPNEEVSQTTESSLKYMTGAMMGNEYPLNPDTVSFDMFEQCSGWPQSDSKTFITSPKPNKRPAKAGEGSEAPQKRSRTSEHDENAGEVNEDGDHRLGGDDGDNRRGETFACPYYRKDPERHLECINLRMPRISDVKQHLKRRHTARYYCSRCSKGFSSQNVYDIHRQENCTRASAANLEFVSPAAQEVIKVRFERSLSSKDQWNKIWEVLFGKRNLTMDPYLDNIFKEVTGIIRGVWTEEGDQIISSSMRGRELPSCSDQLHSLVLEFLNKIETRFEQKPPETNSRESPLNFDISLIADMVGANLEPIPLPEAANLSSNDDVFSSYAIPSEMPNTHVNVSRSGSEGTLQSIKKLLPFSFGTSMQQVECHHMDFATTYMQLPGVKEPWNVVDHLHNDSADNSLPFIDLTKE